MSKHHAQNKQQPRLVIVGNGMAAGKLLETLLGLSPTLATDCAVTVFAAEPHGTYNRILLSPLLAGELSAPELTTHAPEWYRQAGLTLYLSDPVVALDPVAKTVTSATGRTEAWDLLVLATGAQAFMPPLPGSNLAGVSVFRTLADVEAMMTAAQTARHAVVIGGGVLGLEAAWGLRQRGLDVVVVHQMSSLMERSVDSEAGDYLRHHLRDVGVTSILGQRAEALIGQNGRVSAVRLSNGQELVAHVVVVAAGILPETTLARQAGLAVQRGVVVSAALQTSHPDIFAIGECAEVGGQCFGMVKPVFDMATVCAEHLAFRLAHLRAESIFPPATAAFVAPVVPTKLKVPAIPLVTAGEVAAEGEDVHHIIVRQSVEEGIGTYRRLSLRGGHLHGMVFVADVRDHDFFWTHLQAGTNLLLVPQFQQWVEEHAVAPTLDHLRQWLEHSLGQGLPEIEESGSATAVVCHCNGICRQDLWAAMEAHGLASVAEVSARTGAGKGCGQCLPIVAKVVQQRLQEQGKSVDPEQIAALERTTAQMKRGFCYWHRTHAVFMTVLLLTGIRLHFAAETVDLLSFRWAHWLHEASGYGVVVAYGGFLLLSRVFHRQWQATSDGLMMFVGMPLLVVSGLVFLWPQVLPLQAWGVSSRTWVAAIHFLVAGAVAAYLVHHLSHAPLRWWRKRRAASVL